MRLRSFEPFWLVKNGLLHTYPSLRNQQLDADIVVVGGGITGALVSHSLLQAGYSCIMIDKGDIGQGSTSATTAMLQYEIDVPLIELGEQIGKDKAAMCYRAGIQAIADIEKLISNEQIDCGFERKQSLYIAHNARSAKWLQKECAERRHIGIAVEWLSADEVSTRYALKSYGGILSETAASLDAYRFTHELIARNHSKGQRVYDQTVIEKIDCSASGATLYLHDNSSISCKHIMFCNGFEAVSMLKEKTADIFTTFACVSEEGINTNLALQNVLVWDTGNPYFYMRTTDDGRLLLGGEDTDGNKDVDLKRKDTKAKKLIAHLKDISPDIDFVEDFAWAGKFGTTKDGLPYIGSTAQYPGCFFVLGFGGNGITFSVQGMKLIHEMLNDRSHPLLDCYRFGR
jgi:glycine/D-amino acid oxidase-like deaminating enzyme